LPITFDNCKVSAILQRAWTWASAEIFPGEGQRRHFVYPFQLADDANGRSQNALPPSTP